MGDNGVVLFRGAELNALAKTEVRNIVRHRADIVQIELGFTELSAVRPVVPEVPRPRCRITVQSWTVDLKLLIGQFN